MLTVLNDCHLGANRSAGTTPSTKLILRQRLLDQFIELLPRDSDLMILGDLFDTFDINPLDFYYTFTALNNWLIANPTKSLYLVAGNHDLSKTSTTVSSFELLVLGWSTHSADYAAYADQLWLRHSASA